MEVGGEIDGTMGKRSVFIGLSGSIRKADLRICMSRWTSGIRWWVGRFGGVYLTCISLELVMDILPLVPYLIEFGSALGMVSL